MQSDFSSFDDQQPATPSEHHHAVHHHAKPAATSFSLLKAMLIAGPLVFVLLLVVITASVNKNQQPDQMVQTDQPSTMQQPDQTTADTQQNGGTYVPPQNSENRMQAQTVKNYGKIICNGDLTISNITENPACTGNVNASLSTYITRYEIFNRSGTGGNGRSSRTYVLDLQAQSNFCKQGTGNTGSYKCEYVSGQDSGEQLTSLQMTISGGEKKVVEIKRSAPSGLGSGDPASPECGDFQTDLWITKATETVGNTNEKCTWTDTSSQPGKSGWNLLGAALCGTNKNCVNVTPTPTNKPTATPTTIVVKSPTPTTLIIKSPTPTTPAAVTFGCGSVSPNTQIQTGQPANFTCTGTGDAYISQWKIHQFDANNTLLSSETPGMVFGNDGTGLKAGVQTVILPNAAKVRVQCSVCNTAGSCTAFPSTDAAGTCRNTYAATSFTATPTPTSSLSFGCSDLHANATPQPGQYATFYCSGSGQTGTSVKFDVSEYDANGTVINHAAGEPGVVNYPAYFNLGYVNANTKKIVAQCSICKWDGYTTTCTPMGSPSNLCTKTYTITSPTSPPVKSPTPPAKSPTPPPTTTGLCPTSDSGVSLKNGFYVANSTTSLSHVTSRHNINSSMKTVGSRYLFVIPDQPTSTQNPYYGSFTFRNTQGVPVINVWPYDADHVASPNFTKVRITLKNGSYLKPSDGHTVDSSGKITVEKTANNTFAKPINVNGYVTKIEYFPGKDSNGWDSSEFGVECPSGAPLPSINLGEPIEEVSVWSSFFQLVRDLFSF